MNDVLAALGSFFGALAPSDWITSGLSLAAIVISVIALRQVAASHPHSELELEWPHPSDITNANFVGVYVKLFNHGSTPARDVRIDVSTLVKGAGNDLWL